MIKWEETKAVGSRDFLCGGKGMMAVDSNR